MNIPPRTLPLFYWPVERSNAVALLSAGALLSLTLLVIGILGAAKVGNFKHLTSANLKLIFSLSLLIVLLEIKVLLQVHRYVKREGMVNRVLEAWDRRGDALSHFGGCTPHRIGTHTLYVGRMLLTPNCPYSIACDLPAPPPTMTNGMALRRLEEPEETISPSNTPFRPQVWHYALWLREGESVQYSTGMFGVSEGFGGLTYDRGTVGISDGFMPYPGSVTLAELQRRAGLGDQGSLLEPVVTQLLS